MTLLNPPINTSDHMYGHPEARIELVEFGDYECPYCGRAYPLVKSIQRKLGSELKFVFRNFPLAKIHPNARPAAVATEAAALQNRFWEMHNIIFENQRRLDPESLFVYAIRIGLDLDVFKQDIQRNELMKKVEMDFESGLRSGVNKTPTFFVNGVKFNGNWDNEELLVYLEEQLRTPVY